ncbi:FixH family protein [Sphingobacterium sp. Mn56C]
MKIVIGMAAFMLFIVAASIYMVSKDTDSLLEDDYYEKGLNYDQVYEGKQNLLDDAAKPKVNVDNDSIVLTFVAQQNQGELSFKRPSDGHLDKKIPFSTKVGIVRIPIATLEKGNWTLNISWESNLKKYFHAQPLYIQ